MATAGDGVTGVVSHKIGDKLVSELKVEELKAELEQRGLKKSGVKKELQERLTEVRKALLCLIIETYGSTVSY